jgi:hypothetical protein
MADPLEARIVIVLPYLPAAALVVVGVVIGLARTRRRG